MSIDSFHAFERAGWSDPAVVEHYHTHLSKVTRQSVDALLEAAGASKGKQLLDIATGPGYVAAAAAALGAQATGGHFSPTQIALARRDHPQLLFKEADVENLPFADNTFDCVVSAFGMPHFPDPAKALSEMHRVLKPAGRVAFTVWDVPERAVGFGAIYGAIRTHGTLDVSLPAGPNFFLFSDPGTSINALSEAGFDSPNVSVVRQLWLLDHVDDAFATFMYSTVRASATLRAQTPAALEAIRGALREVIERYRDGDRYIVPMPAVLATGIKRG